MASIHDGGPELHGACAVYYGWKFLVLVHCVSLFCITEMQKQIAPTAQNRQKIASRLALCFTNMQKCKCVSVKKHTKRILM